MTERMNIDALSDDILDWADRISPGRMPANTVVKLVSESSELLDAIINNGSREEVESELGDCVILLLDLASMFGLDLVEAGHKKMGINRSRKWAADGHVIRRIKES